MAITIECKPDGPYLVKGLEDLADSAGGPVAHDAVFALCRCGGSANKPFCDGTHRQNGFSGARLADGGGGDKLETYRAPGITIRDNRSICAHAGICTDRLASVFKYGSEPWIDGAGAGPDAIAAVIDRCPSGALSYGVQGMPAAKPLAPRVAITRDGPYAVTGPVELVNAPWAQGASRDRYTLCRCGASRNKPFCDGSHWDVGFKHG